MYKPKTTEKAQQLCEILLTLNQNQLYFIYIHTTYILLIKLIINDITNNKNKCFTICYNYNF